MNQRFDPDQIQPPAARVAEPEGPARARIDAPRRPSRLARALKGGAPDDLRRLPRYAALLGALLVLLWGPLIAYATLAPKAYTSRLSLILPGSGANASVNLYELGQASSTASSAYSSSSLSPTVTYKELIASDRVRAAAAALQEIPFAEAPRPRVKLIDQTGLIGVEIAGPSPEIAQARAEATLAAFLAQLDDLRRDEVQARELGARQAIADYRDSVARTRARITRLKSDTGLISADQHEALAGEAAGLAARARDAQAALAAARAELSALGRALGADPAEAAAVIRLQADPEFQRLSQESAARAADLAVARGAFGPNHPVLVAARDAHGGAQARMTARAVEVTGLTAARLAALAAFAPEGAQAELMARLVEASAARDGLAAEEAALAARAQAARARLMALVPAAAELDDLGRDYMVAEAVFASAMARSDTSKSDIYASYPLVQVLEPPSLPEAPSSPRVKLALAGGAAASLMLMTALALAWSRRPLIDRLLVQKAAA